MAKFIFETLENSSTVYRGPSGTNYDIMRGQPFKVENKQDVKFFEENKRFKKAGIFTKSKPMEDDSEEKFKDELLKLDGFGVDVAELVVEIYRSEKDFVDYITTGAPLETTIPIVEQEMLVRRFMPKELQHDSLQEETPEVPKKVEPVKKSPKKKDSK